MGLFSGGDGVVRSGEVVDQPPFPQTLELVLGVLADLDSEIPSTEVVVSVECRRRLLPVAPHEDDHLVLGGYQLRRRYVLLLLEAGRSKFKGEVCEGLLERLSRVALTFVWLARAFPATVLATSVGHYVERGSIFHGTNFSHLHKNDSFVRLSY